MFAGQFRHTLDSKGRVTIPSRLRDEIARVEVSAFWVTRGMEGCLFLYTPQTWKKLISQFPDGISTRKRRHFIRMFFSNAIPCEWDKQGRVLIPDELRQFANISKDVVIVGVFDRIEIWDPKRWEEFQRENTEKYEEYAEDIFGQRTEPPEQ